MLCLCVQNASEPDHGVDRVERLSCSKVACREFVVSGKACRDCYQKARLVAGRHEAASVRANTRTPAVICVAITGVSCKPRSATNRRPRFSVVVDKAGSALTFRATCNCNHSLSIQFRFPHSQVNMRIVRPVRGTRMLVMNLGRFPQSEQVSAIDCCSIGVSRS